MKRTATQLQEIGRELIRASLELNSARGELRSIACTLAGCDLSDWTFSDIERYVTGRIEAQRIKELKEATAKVLAMLAGIDQALQEMSRNK